MWILLLTIYLLGIIVSNWLAILYFRKDDDISISQLIAIILTSFFSWLSLVSLFFLWISDPINDKTIIKKK